ncbi:YybH family protein [Christiangramia fulva]|nr:nuclear transport factor 2 family protein [Christiangramia fulva]
MRKIISFLLLTSFTVLLACGDNNKPSASASGNVDIKKEKKAVEQVLNKFKEALVSQNLDSTLSLYSRDSQIFESGGMEGSYNQYLEQHLKPEFEEFESFNFTNYFMDVRIAYPYAFTTETYNYSIDLRDSKSDNPEKFDLKGVATSVLKKEKGAWKIIKRHSSSRKRP